VDSPHEQAELVESREQELPRRDRQLRTAAPRSSPLLHHLQPCVRRDKPLAIAAALAESTGTAVLGVTAALCAFADDQRTSGRVAII
jgi:hypothetical protein